MESRYSRIRAMTTHNQAANFRAVKLVNLAACVVSLFTFLTLPLQSAHRFADHLRTPEVRRSIERHTPIAQPESETAARIPREAKLPTRIIPIDAAETITPFSNIELSSQPPRSRLLSRLKLCTRSSSTPDPLL
jgi:hypothetical protein